MVGGHSGQNRHSAQRTTEPLSQVYETTGWPAAGDDTTTGLSALRALLLLSGAVAPTDASLARTSDVDIACFAEVMTLLGRSNRSTHAA